MNPPNGECDMRRTASEMISDLEVRIARLESRRAFFSRQDIYDDAIDMIASTQGPKVEVNKRKRRSSSLMERIDGRFTNGSTFKVTFEFHPIDVDMGKISVVINNKPVFYRVYKYGLAKFIASGALKEIPAS